MLFFFVRKRRPPKSTLTDTLFPYTTLFRSGARRTVGSGACRCRGPSGMTRLEGAPICPSFRRARVSARLRNPPAAPTCEATMKLEGVKVVDLSVFLPGPYLTMAMAAHGAEVIKVEPPGEGDPDRKSTRLNSSH